MKKLLILIVGLLLLGLCSCGTTETQPESTEPAEVVNSVESVKQVIYEDQNVKATFEGVNNHPFVEGMTTVAVLLENLTDHEITVYPRDSSANGMMVQFCSGAPATIQGNKKVHYIMFFNNEMAGITDAREVTTLEFALSVDDADFHEISKSEALIVEIK